MEQSDQSKSRLTSQYNSIESLNLSLSNREYFHMLKDKQLEIMEKNLQMKNNAMEALTNALEENHNVELKADDQDLMDPEEDKIVTLTS